MVCMGRLRARSHEGGGQERAFALFGVDPSPVMYTRLPQLGSPADLEFTLSVFPSFKFVVVGRVWDWQSHSGRDSDHRTRE